MKKNDWRKVPNQNWGFVREMRAEPTMPERVLWRALRANQLGVHFRRQHVIGPFIVDFCAPRAQLVIELDGDSHAGDSAIEMDRSRDDYLRASGFRVKRYTNRDILSNLPAVLQDIADCLNSD